MKLYHFLSLVPTTMFVLTKIDDKSNKNKIIIDWSGHNNNCYKDLNNLLL